MFRERYVCLCVCGRECVMRRRKCDSVPSELPQPPPVFPKSQFPRFYAGT